MIQGRLLPENQKRHSGIELLRINAMFMIVMLHVIGHGGIQSAVENGSGGAFWTLWTIKTISMCAVNCYALISGYVGWNKQVKLERVLELWCKVVFYTISLTLLMKLIDPTKVYLDTIINAFVPVTSGQYWYITAYFGLMILMPFINLGIRQFTQKQSMVILYVISLALVTIPMLLPDFSVKLENYGLNNGYSTMWLACLYFVGGVCEKYHLLEKITVKKGMSVFFGTVLAVLGFKAIIRGNPGVFPGSWIHENRLLQYGTPTMTLQGLMLLAVFAKFEVSERMKKIVYPVAQASLGVYLFHEFSPVKYGFIVDSFQHLAYGSAIKMVLGIMRYSLTIYVIGICYDFARMKLFGLFKIREKCSVLTKKIDCILFPQK